MKAAIVSALKENIKAIEYNPASIRRVALDTLKEIHEGEVETIDADTPFGFLVQVAAVNTSVMIDEAYALTRKQYPVEAQTEEDLYLHMSDRDYLNRFAIPSTARFTFAFDKNELLQKLVEDDELGIRKLIIPRNTEVKVNNITFTLLYPIEIRQLQHGGLQIVFNNNIATPLQTLDTNIIEYEIIETKEMDWLMFDVKLHQLVIKTIYSDADKITNTEEDIILNDKYYYLRAYVENNGRWVEFKTTHTDQVYDVLSLTAVLKVFQDRVNVKIPQIYNSTDLITGRLRFDLYETNGYINADLSIYPPNVFITRFVTDDFDLASTPYSAPLKNFKTLSIFSEDITDGGNDEMTFDELRNVVINNSVGAQVIPMTPTQAATKLARNGYDIVTNIDNVTNRSFLATKQLPAPNNRQLITAASASIETIIVTEEEARNNTSIKSNFRSVTITPDTLFENKSGVMKIVPSAKQLAITSLNPELRANEVTKNNYYYTQFHYVMDFNLDDFSVRPYYLDKPTVLYKSFVSDNDKTLIQVSIDTFEVERVETGYRLNIRVKSSENYKEIPDNEVFVQLAFKPTGEKHYAYLPGKLMGIDVDTEERIFSFDLSTNFHVDKDDEIQFTQFKMFTVDERLVGSLLENDFEVLFSTSRDMPTDWQPDDVDKKLGTFLLPNPVFGITNERLRIRFGHALKNLWCRSRSVITDNDYKRHATDVPMYYLEDVYERNSATNSAVEIVDGTVNYRILHRKGDPVVDADGNQVYKHRAGEIVYKPNGKPEYSNEYHLIRQLDIMLVEGAYWFATDEVTVAYRQEIVDTFVNWIIDGLGDLSKNLLEQTNIYFYPKSTVGQIDVMVNNSLRTIIDSGQSFKVRLYVSSVVYSNLDLRQEIHNATVRVLSSELKKEVVSNSNIISKLKEAYNDDIIAFEIEGLGGSSRIETITMLNDAKRLSLRKRLVSQGDGTLIVEEDVTTDFIRHDKKELD